MSHPVREMNTRDWGIMKPYDAAPLWETLAMDYPHEHPGKYAFRLCSTEGKEMVVFLPTAQMVNAFAKRKWSISLPVKKTMLMLCCKPLKDVYYPIEFFVEYVGSDVVSKLITAARDRCEGIYMYHDGVLYGLAYWPGENICNDSRVGMSACDVDDQALEWAVWEDENLDENGDLKEDA